MNENIQRDMPIKDNKKLENHSQKLMLKTFLNKTIALNAPFLAIAKLADEQCIGTITSSTIKDIKIIDDGGCKISKIKFNHNTESEYFKKELSLDSILYYLKSANTPYFFDPFVMLVHDNTANKYIIFAFATENEFIFDRLKLENEVSLESFEKELFEKIMVVAKKRKLYYLMRCIDTFQTLALN